MFQKFGGRGGGGVSIRGRGLRVFGFGLSRGFGGVELEVWGLQFGLSRAGVQGLKLQGLGVKGLGFRSWGLGFRV